MNNLQISQPNFLKRYNQDKWDNFFRILNEFTLESNQIVFNHFYSGIDYKSFNLSSLIEIAKIRKINTLLYSLLNYSSSDLITILNFYDSGFVIKGTRQFYQILFSILSQVQLKINLFNVLSNEIFEKFEQIFICDRLENNFENSGYNLTLLPLNFKPKSPVFVNASPFNEDRFKEISTQIINIWVYFYRYFLNFNSINFSDKDALTLLTIYETQYIPLLVLPPVFRESNINYMDFKEEIDSNNDIDIAFFENFLNSGVTQFSTSILPNNFTLKQLFKINFYLTNSLNSQNNVIETIKNLFSTNFSRYFFRSIYPFYDNMEFESESSFFTTLIFFTDLFKQSILNHDNIVSLDNSIKDTISSTMDNYFNNTFLNQIEDILSNDDNLKPAYFKLGITII